MKTLHFTATASADLDAILDFIARDRPHTAVQVVKKIRNKCELLVDHPEIGQAYPKLGATVRGIPQQRWAIFYRVQSETIEILRILDAARDIDDLLD